MTDKLEEILKSRCSVIVGDLGELKEAFVAGQSTKCKCIAGDTSASRCKCFDAGHKSCEAAHMSEIAEFEAKIGAYEENLLDKNQRIAELEGALFWVEENYRGTTAGDCARKALSEKIPERLEKNNSDSGKGLPCTAAKPRAAGKGGATG